MTMGSSRRRPGAVTFSVVLMYLGGVAQILLGVLTIFLRYSPEVQANDTSLPITLLGAGMILFGLLVIGLASGVARGSGAARQGTAAVLLIGLAFAVLDLFIAGDNDWSAVVVQTVEAVAVLLPLWIGRGRTYFIAR